MPPGAEARERRLALALAAVAVDPGDVEPRHAHLPGNAVRAPLRPHEHEHGHHVLPAEKPDQEGGLEVRGDRERLMPDRRRRPLGRRHGDPDRGAHDRPGEQHDLLGNRRGEEEGLAIPRQDVDDPPDVGQEPHVEHPVGLVEDENPQRPEVHVPAGHVVEQPSGGRDDDVDPASESVFLRRHPDAAVHRVGVEPRPLRKAAERRLDLRR